MNNARRCPAGERVAGLEEGSSLACAMEKACPEALDEEIDLETPPPRPRPTY